MYIASKLPILADCPRCSAVTRCHGRTFEIRGSEKLKTLISWHMGCGCIIRADKYERVDLYRRMSFRAVARV